SAMPERSGRLEYRTASAPRCCARSCARRSTCSTSAAVASPPAGWSPSSSRCSGNRLPEQPSASGTADTPIMSGSSGALRHKLLSFIAISLSLWLGLGIGNAQAQVSAPELAARAWILVDMTTGQVLAEHNADERYEPASLTKVMTAYVVFRALEDKRISLDQRPPVS